MRLKPGLNASEAYQMLAAAATASWGAATAASLEKRLREIAEAMEAVGGLDIDDEAEPLFGQNEGLSEASA